MKIQIDITGDRYLEENENLEVLLRYSKSSTVQK